MPCGCSKKNPKTVKQTTTPQGQPQQVRSTVQRDTYRETLKRLSQPQVPAKT